MRARCGFSAGIGILMSIVMQSSTAAGATTLVALNAGSLTFPQGCAMIVGQSVGTAATTGLMVFGGGLAVRRSALAHIVFSLIVGFLGMLFLRPLTAASEWVGAQLYDPDGVLALATFSSLFKLAGIVAFYPFLDQFARFIERISGSGSESAVSRLEATLTGAGGPVALEAAWRAHPRGRTRRRRCRPSAARRRNSSLRASRRGSPADRAFSCHHCRWRRPTST